MEFIVCSFETKKEQLFLALCINIHTLAKSIDTRLIHFRHLPFIHRIIALHRCYLYVIFIRVRRNNIMVS